MTRITLTLTEGEKQALIQLSEAERRNPRDQGALLLRRALENAGFLAPAAGNRSPQEVSA